MQVTLEIKNADENLLKALKGVIKLSPKAKVRVRKDSEIYTKEFIESMKEAEREFEEARKNGTLKTYKSAEEAFKAEGII